MTPPPPFYVYTEPTITVMNTSHFYAYTEPRIIVMTPPPPPPLLCIHRANDHCDEHIPFLCVHRAKDLCYEHIPFLCIHRDKGLREHTHSLRIQRDKGGQAGLFAGLMVSLTDQLLFYTLCKGSVTVTLMISLTDQLLFYTLCK